MPEGEGWSGNPVLLACCPVEEPQLVHLPLKMHLTAPTPAPHMSGDAGAPQLLGSACRWQKCDTCLPREPLPNMAGRVAVEAVGGDSGSREAAGDARQAQRPWPGMAATSGELCPRHAAQPAASRAGLCLGVHRRLLALVSSMLWEGDKNGLSRELRPSGGGLAG